MAALLHAINDDMLAILSTKKAQLSNEIFRRTSYSFFSKYNSSNIGKFISSSAVCINRKMLAYSTMFCLIFDLITMDYIMAHIEFTDNRASISGTT